MNQENDAKLSIDISNFCMTPKPELLRLMDKVASQVCEENKACDFNMDKEEDTLDERMSHVANEYFNKHGSFDGFNYSFVIQPYFFMADGSVECFSCHIPATQTMWIINW